MNTTVIKQDEVTNKLLKGSIQEFPAQAVLP